MNLDTHQSVYREQLLEHLLIGELLKYSWLNHDATLEVSQPAIDRSGHDVVLEAHGITRHVQLETSAHSSSTATQKVHVSLGEKPSGCVIWIKFDPTTLELGPFYFFGNKPGLPMPDINGLKVAKHTKANSQGLKLQRANFRVVPRARFDKIDRLDGLYQQLFG
jgi:hypothetical protein